MNEIVTRLDVAQAGGARFTTAEFLRMNDAGAFDDMRVELVNGELERMNASQTAHARLQMRIGSRLSAIVGDDHVLGAIGIDFSGGTVLECDVAMLVAPIAENRWLKPGEIMLVVEISQSTTARDMGLKRERYAAADIQNYWVVDAERAVVHIYGMPQSGEYARVSTISFGEHLPVPGTDRTIVLN